MISQEILNTPLGIGRNYAIRRPYLAKIILVTIARNCPLALVSDVSEAAGFQTTDKVALVHMPYVDQPLEQHSFCSTF